MTNLNTRWRSYRIPGGVIMSCRQRYLGRQEGAQGRQLEPLLVEDIVLEEMPLELEQRSTERLYRRK